MNWWWPIGVVVGYTIYLILDPFNQYGWWKKK